MTKVSKKSQTKQSCKTGVSGSFSYEDMKRAYLSGGCKEEWFEVTGDESVRLPDFEKWISTQKIYNKKFNFSELEAKWLLCYGEESRESKVKLDDEGRIDYQIDQMFDLLEKHTFWKRKEIEDLFWKRITSLANYR